jgi:hypothetical protein
VSRPDSEVTIGRGIAAVLGALLFFALATRVLEQTLGSPLLTLLLNVGVAFLVGAISARIAGAQEITVIGVAATVETCMLAYGWIVGAYAALPLWMRALLLLTTGPAMVAGAWVRMQARLAAASGAAGKETA